MTDPWHAAGINPPRPPEEIDMNPLQSIPPTVRKWFYVGYAVALIVLGAIQVGYGSADAPSRCGSTSS
jgi:hypothetical protein